MCIGESPWYDEIAAGTPFAGAAGSVFDRLLQRVDLDRRDVVVTNSAWCKAPRLGFYDSRDPNAAMAMAQCRPYLDALIDRMKPKVLVPMGNVALRRVCGVSGIESYAGYVLDTVYGIPAVPTFHPSFLLRGNQKLSAAVIYALDRAKQVARFGYTPQTPDLLLDPSPKEMCEYINRYPCSSVFLDLETPKRVGDSEDDNELDPSYQILRASFSLADNTAVSFPWNPQYIEVFQELLDRATETVEWATAHYDTKRLAAAGLRLPAIRISAQWAWHFLQSDLPKALGKVAPYFGTYAPWKQLSASDPARYSALDSLEGRRCWLGTKNALHNVGRWGMFVRHCIEIDPILGQMGKTGVLVDQPEQARFMGTIQSEHDAAYAELQQVVPDRIKVRKYYKRLPKEIDPTCPVRQLVWSIEDVEPGLQPTAHAGSAAQPSSSKSTTLPMKAVSPSDSQEERTLLSGDSLKSQENGNYETVSSSAIPVTSKKRRKLMGGAPSSTALIQVTQGARLGQAADAPCAELLVALTNENGTSSTLTTPETATADSHSDVEKQDSQPLCRELASSILRDAGYQYVRILPFNPNSSDQVQALAKALKVKLPKKYDAAGTDEDSLTTEHKFLLAPARNHKAFALVLRCRERGKLINTYKWGLNSAGRVTTVYGFHPATWRKSSRSANLQNIPKRSHLAKQFRRMIVAAPGHMLVEADSQAIEAVLVGWFAGSERYIRLAKAGVHGWLTAAYHSKPISLSDPDLAALCAESKAQWPDTYEKCKRVIHLSNYKGTPTRIAEEYPEDFPTVAAARKLQEFYFETEPGQDIRKWQDKVCLQAAHDCYLENPFRYRHWFYSVSQWDRRRECYVAGDDAKRAIAFLPQSTASACQSEVLLRLAQYENMRSWLRLIIHDSFLCEPPEGDALTCAAMLRDEMLQPIGELGGLQIGVEVSIGRNWGEMHKV